MTTLEKIRAEITELFKASGISNSSLCFAVLQIIDKYAEQEPCVDVVSREWLKKKLQEHHDFFVNAYGGFKNMPQTDKARVDEITNCIAEVVNAPSVRPQEQTGHWIHIINDKWKCSRCENIILTEGSWEKPEDKYCKECGAKMVEPKESEE